MQKREKRAPLLLDANALWSFALKVLGGRALSTAELKEKLRKRAEDPSEIDGVVARLKEYGYLNDPAFAESYSTARRDNQGFGKARVLRDLRQRRIAPAVAEKAVEQSFGGTDETALIEQFLERKYRKIALVEYLQEDKHLASAYRRLQYAGYSSGASIRVLKRYAARAEELETTVDE